MRRLLLVLSLLALVLLAALVLGATMGMAQTTAPLHDPRPSPTPDGLGPASSPASPDLPGLPDLVVTSIEVAPPTPVIDEPATIRVRIENRGTAGVPVGPPPQNFYTDLYVDPAIVPIQPLQESQLSWGVQAYWLPAGGSVTLEARYVFEDVKPYALYAQVDTDNQVVPELDEHNNVLGPVHVQVVAPSVLVHESHEDFQMGLASSLDTSHPEGVLRQGIFVEPFTETGVLMPDVQVDHPPDPPANTNNVEQVKPSLASDGRGRLFAAWEDGRNGGHYNRDIYFSRSEDGGRTWSSPDVRVNWDDPISHTANQLDPELLYDSSRGRLYAVWQDGRDGDYDIYFSYSDDGGTTWSENVRVNDDLGSADQLNPSLAIGPPPAVLTRTVVLTPTGSLTPTVVVEPVDFCNLKTQELTRTFSCEGGKCLYVAWQDQRNGNDDIYLARSEDGGETWGKNYFVTDDPDMTGQNHLAPSVGVDTIFGHVHVAWEDWRDPAHPEIYYMWSFDGGETFGLDVPLTIVPPEARDTYRVEPSLLVTTNIETITEYEFNPVLGYTVTRIYTTPLMVDHVVWQDGAPDGADIYYTYSAYDWCKPKTCPYPYEFCFDEPRKVSGFAINSDYVRPPGEGSGWEMEPSWQGEVTLDLVPDLPQFSTLCHADSTTVYAKGLVVAWSDARSFDDWRTEIRTRRVASPGGDPRSYEPCEDWATGVVNDNAKIYAFRDDTLYPNSGEPNQYEIFQPAATGQFNPAVLVDATGIYAMWDDDRWDDPTVAGTMRDRDVFFARMGANPEGIYLSPVIDGIRPDSTWYVLSWWGATQHAGDLLLQTRFGDTPYPPRDDVAANTWTRWTGNPSSTYLGCVAGAGCYYDAPGRHIVGPDGTESPTYRYMQYKVIIRGADRLTALSRATIYYLGPRHIYLPLVVRGH
jgi:hypothetical protein